MGQGLVTWGPPAVEDVDIHQVLQVLLQGLPVQPRQPVGTLDALGLPVGPVDALPMGVSPNGWGSWLPISTCQGQRLRHAPTRSDGTEQASRAHSAGTPCCVSLELELVLSLDLGLPICDSIIQCLAPRVV